MTAKALRVGPGAARWAVAVLCALVACGEPTAPERVSLRLEGTVTHGGAPVEGASVSLTVSGNWRDESVRTDADGWYRLTYPVGPCGKLKFHLSAFTERLGFARETYRVDCTGAVQVFDFTL